MAAFELDELDAIIVNAAGCGAMLKDYAHILPEAEHDGATRFMAKVKDISEFLVALGPIAADGSVAAEGGLSRRLPPLPCPADPQPARALLAMIPGLELVPLEESEICCGAAGTYNLTQPEMSERLGRRKMDHIEATGPRWSSPATSAASSRSPARSRNAASPSRSPIRSTCSTGRTAQWEGRKGSVARP